jgi:TP901 family phage tail tape measure protein
MALNSIGLGLLFTAQDRASGTVTGLTRNVRGLEGQADKTSRTLQTGLGGAAALALGSSLSMFTDQAATFEFGLAKVKSIAVATAEDMDVLRDAAFEAGLKTQFSPQQAVEGLQNLAAAGFTAAESAFLLDKSLVLAQAGQISVADATATVATSVKLFALNTEEQVDLVDKLLKTTNLFKIQAGDLEQGLAKTSAAALLTNQNMDEMLLTMGLIKNVFPSAEEAGNSISRAMLGISKNADLLQSKLGVDVIDPDTGGFRDALDLFIEIDKKSKSMVTDTVERANLLDKVFGKFGAKGFAAAIGSLNEFTTKNNMTMEEGAKNLRSAIAGAEGTADRFLSDINSTFQGQRIILEGAIQTLMVAIGEPLNRILKPAMKAAADGVANLARMIRDMDPAVKDAAARIALFASGFLAIGGALAMARVAGVILLPVLKGMVVSLAGAALAAAPLALLLGTVGAAIAGLRDGMGGVDSSMNGFATSGKKVVLTLQAIGQILSKGRLSGELIQQIDEIEFFGLKAFIDILADMRSATLAFFRGVRTEFAAAVTTLGPAIQRLGAAFVELGRAFGFVAEESGDVRQALPSSAFFNAGATASRIMTTAIEALARVLAAVVRFGAEVISGIRSAFADAGPVIEAFGRALGTLAHNLGLAGESMFAGADGGASFGESLGSSIGKILILGIRLATVMVEATTAVVAGFEAMMPVLRPIFEFLADHIETIAAIVGGRFALAFGVKAAGGVSKLATKMKLFTVGGRGRNAQGQFQTYPSLMERIKTGFTNVSIKAKAVGRAFLFMGRAALKSLFAISKLAIGLISLTAKGIIFGLRGIVLGIRAIGAALLMNPIGLIITGIALAATALIIYWEPISEFFISLWNKIVSGFMTVWDPVASFFSDLFDDISSIATTAAEAIQAAWVPVDLFFQFLWDGIVDVFQDAWNYIEEIVGWVVDAADTVLDVGGDIKDFFGDGLSDVGDFFGDVVPSFNFVGDVMGAAQEATDQPTALTSVIESAPSFAAIPATVQRSIIERATTPGQTGGQSDAVVSLMEGIKQMANRPIVIEVDGRQIAIAVAEGARENAADQFQPVPTPDLF